MKLLGPRSTWLSPKTTSHPKDRDRPWYGIDAIGHSEARALARGVVPDRVRRLFTDLTADVDDRYTFHRS
jgi:hypothetical protein